MNMQVSLSDRLFLYARPIVITSNARVQDCAAALQILHKPREAYFQFTSREVILSQISSQEFRVEIQAKRRNRSWDYITAHLFGTLSLNRESVTTLEGYIRFGSVYTAISIFVAVLTLGYIVRATQIGLNNDILLAFGLTLATAYIWWTVFSDRRKLKMQIHWAMAQAKQVEKKP